MDIRQKYYENILTYSGNTVGRYLYGLKRKNLNQNRDSNLGPTDFQGTNYEIWFQLIT